MRIVNLTPHEVVIINGGVKRTFPSEGNARLSIKTVQIGELDGIPVFTTEFRPIEGLPDEAEDIVYIVRPLVAQQCKHRHDVFIPTKSVFDESRHFIGHRSLKRI